MSSHFYIPNKSTQSDEWEDRVCEETSDKHSGTMMNISIRSQLYIYCKYLSCFMDWISVVLSFSIGESLGSIFFDIKRDPLRGWQNHRYSKFSIMEEALKCKKGKSPLRVGIFQRRSSYFCIEYDYSISDFFIMQNIFTFYCRFLAILASASVCMSLSVLSISVPESGMTRVDLLMRASRLLESVSMSLRFLTWSAV